MSLVFRQELFDFPIVLLGADRKLKVFLRDRVPILGICKLWYWASAISEIVSYLVHHHHSQEVADCSKEKSIQVVLHAVADCITEDVKDHLANNEEEYSKGYISKWPPVLQSIGDKDDLHYQIKQQAYAVDKVKDNE